MGVTNDQVIETDELMESSPAKTQILEEYNGYFKDKTIVVTGARKGIGRELVKLFHAEGAKVYAVSRFTEHLKSLKERYPGVTPIACNLKNWKDTEEALNENIEGSVNFLVNNAEEIQRENFLQSTSYVMDRVIDINVKGLMAVSKVIAQKMIDGGQGGSIVNISSLASIKPSLSPGLFAYCSSKAAADMITRCMAVELSQFNIRVNSVNPTIIVNDFRKDFWTNTDETKAASQTLELLTPLKRFAVIDDVLPTVVFLLSDKSSMITGVGLKIDGGFAAR